jgi:tryptophan synthase alpha chain
LGFGISKPEHVRGAAKAGAAGAISGSAVVRIVERNLKDEKKLLSEIAEFVRAMKEATR